MAKRRLCEEANSLDEVNSPVANLTVHGAVTSVSPVKRGNKSMFFDGMLADNTSRVRLFGFDSFQQRKLDELHRNRLPAEISNCEVKRSRYHEGFEVMLKNFSEIKQSTRDLDVQEILENEPSAEYQETSDMTLDQLPEMQLFRKVQVPVKAIIVHDAVTITNKTKQDIIVADRSSTAKLTLWEDNVNSLEEGRCYRLVDFVVRIWQGVKYLSRGESSQLLPIDDIGEVAAGANEEEITYKNVTIIGVPQLDSYKSCLKCKARVEPGNLPLGSCSSQDCGMSQRFDLCSDYSAAKLMIQYTTSGTGQSKIAQVQVTGRSMLMLIASCRAEDAIEITQDLLLRAPPISWIRVLKRNRIVSACSSFVTCDND